MNTLKMKVLLFLSNRYLFRAMRKAITVWFITNLCGCAILCVLGFFPLQSPDGFIQSLVLSLIFSSPAIVIAAGVVYSLSSLNNIFKRVTLSIASIAVTSGAIILLVAWIFHFEYVEVIWVLYPFALSAIACFFLIARKEIIPVKNLIN